MNIQPYRKQNGAEMLRIKRAHRVQWCLTMAEAQELCRLLSPFVERGDKKIIAAGNGGDCAISNERAS